MSSKYIILAIVLIVSFLILGCETAPLPPVGDSVNMAIEMQKLDPTPAGLDPVEGMDGDKAVGILMDYKVNNSEGLPEEAAPSMFNAITSD